MLSWLEALAKRFTCIGNVRGLGAMIAFELVKDAKTKEPDAELTASILVHAEKRGLIYCPVEPRRMWCACSRRSPFPMRCSRKA